MLIRPETPADHAAIREINLAAFADHPYSRQTEHLIVEALRAAGALAGLDELRNMGAQGCVLVGDPAFYTRLGFRQAKGLSYPGVPQEFVLCLPLAGPEPEGDVGHHPAFEAGL
jgi:putative acetyltransferase